MRRMTRRCVSGAAVSVAGLRPRVEASVTMATAPTKPDDKPLFLLASNVPDLERLVKQIHDVVVYSFYSDFSYAHKEIAYNASKYPRAHFNRVCWVVTPLPADAKDAKVNYIDDIAQYPEPFFRYLLDILAVHLENGAIVDVVEVRGDDYTVTTSFQLVINEWRNIPRSMFDAHYSWDFEHRKKVVPTTPASYASNKVVWQAEPDAVPDDSADDAVAADTANADAANADAANADPILQEERELAEIVVVPVTEKVEPPPEDTTLILEDSTDDDVFPPHIDSSRKRSARRDADGRRKYRAKQQVAFEDANRFA